MQTLKLTKKYEKYPEYKDSNVEWIGKIPKDWNVYRAKNLFKKMNRSPHESDDIITAFRDGVVTLRKNRREDGFTMADKEIGYQKILKGDLVIHGMDAFAGAIGVSNADGKSSPVYSACIPLKGSNARYHAYLLRHMSKSNYIFALAKGIRERSTEFRFKEFGNLKISEPTIDEQEKIANYLDEKTFLIDQIIEKKQKLIELLREKRTATINHAVTKGLDQKVEFVDSGISWIGKIPKGWRIKKLKFLGEAIIGLTYSPEELVREGGVLVLRSSNVQKDKITLDDNVYVNKTIPKKLTTQVGDILICSRNGSRSLIGKNAIIDKGSAGLSFGAFMTIFRTKHSRFISYFLKSNLFMSQLSTTLTSTINQLTTHYLNNTVTIVPPEDEQEKIAFYLDEKITSHDKAISHVEQSIEKLQEFKSSLISNVVTGKIKV